MAIDWTTVGVVAGSIFGSQALTEYVKSRAAKPKTEADAAQTLIEQIMKWAGTLNERIQKLEADNEALRNKITELELRVCSTCPHS